MREQKNHKNRYRTSKANRQATKKRFVRSIQRMDRKIFLLLALLVLLFVVLIGRLFYVQIIASEDLSRQAIKQMTRTTTVVSDRGLILDSEGNKLVSNVSKSNISIDLNQLNSLENKDKIKEDILKTIPKILEIDRENLNKKLDGNGVVNIAQDVDHTKALEIKRKNIPAIVIDDNERRYYTGGNLASHVLGFTNRDNLGIYGLEAYYNDVLSGVAGKSVVFADTSNTVMPGTEENLHAPESGLNLVLTLNSSIQKKVEEILLETKKESQAKRVACIVQETKTGRILAMSTKDDFDLNHPRSPQTEEQKQNWDRLSQEEKKQIWYNNWHNFNISSVYEPGSTFKTITAAAALEENTTDPKKHYYCTGYIRDLPGVTISCSSLPNPEGDLTMAEGFYNSCNTTFVKIARELGKEKFYDYISGFGFGELTGIDLPAEEEGLIPDGPKDITDIDLATMSYGHSVAVTPIQLITAISAVSNGGYLMQPSIVQEFQKPTGEVVRKVEPKVVRQVISKSTSDKMLELLEGVVEYGTGSLAKIDGYRVGGKTGTAGKLSGKGGYEKDKYISSFVGVAPINDPEITVLVIVEEPQGDYYGGTVAAPNTGKIIESALETLGIEKEAGNEPNIERKIIVPDVEDMLLEDAGKTLTSEGLKFNTSASELNEFSVVTSQSPKAGTEVDEGTIVDLQLDPNDAQKKRMPLLIGKSAEEVEDILKQLDLSYVMEGEGEVIEQSPNNGEIISEDTKIVVKLAPPLNQEKVLEDNNNEITENNKGSSENRDKKE